MMTYTCIILLTFISPVIKKFSVSVPICPYIPFKVHPTTTSHARVNTILGKQTKHSILNSRANPILYLLGSSII